MEEVAWSLDVRQGGMTDFISNPSVYLFRASERPCVLVIVSFLWIGTGPVRGGGGSGGTSLQVCSVHL